ncbi:MAG: hypothetical protein JWN99_949 [Ilumatobacteraceae bacterium]|nr:hypothetical protein [Ilumatobacteraceae bacterium]
MNNSVRGITVAAALGAGISGGVLFAFSTFVMRGLGRVPDHDGIVAMQSINREAPSPVFMTAFMGTAVLCLALIVIALRHRDQPWSTTLLIGGALYVSALLITAACHIPHNDSLALVDAGSADGARAWRSYVRNWTAWNHVRTATALGGSLAFILALAQD